MTKKQLFLMIFLVLLFCFPYVFGDCYCSVQDKLYYEKEEVFPNCYCDSPTEKSDPYVIAYYNDTDNLLIGHNNTGTTPAVPNNNFFGSFVVPEFFPDQTGNFSFRLFVNDVFKNKTFFEVTNKTAHFLRINDFNYQENVTLGYPFKLRFSVYGDTGKKVINSLCHINLITPKGLPISEDQLKLSDGDGSVSVLFDSNNFNDITKNDLINNYLEWDIVCVCLTNCTTPTEAGCCVIEDESGLVKLFHYGETFKPILVIDDITFPDYDLDNIVLSLIIILAYFGLLGFIILRFDSDTDKVPFWFGFLCVALSFLELMLLLGIVFVDASQKNIIGLLKINFYFVGTIGAFIGVVVLLFVIISILNIKLKNKNNKFSNYNKWG